jgi:hypothetical protein
VIILIYMKDRKIEPSTAPIAPIAPVIPQVHAEKCPVCNGFGTLKFGEIICRGCQGKGYIHVPNFIKGDA